MENLHTEKTLKGLNKEQLLAIAAANEIEIADGAKNDDIKALILTKGCSIASEKTSEKTNEQEQEQAAKSNAPKFSKTQILASKWFTHRRDVLGALLDDKKEYSHAEVDKILGEFLKGKVK